MDSSLTKFEETRKKAAEEFTREIRPKLAKAGVLFRRLTPSSESTERNEYIVLEYKAIVTDNRIEKEALIMSVEEFTEAFRGPIVAKTFARTEFQKCWKENSEWSPFFISLLFEKLEKASL